MDVQKRKTIVIVCLTSVALLIASLHIWAKSVPEDAVEDPALRQVMYLLLLLPFPAVLACSVGVLVAMWRWAVNFWIKVGIIAVLAYALVSTVFMSLLLFFWPAI